MAHPAEGGGSVPQFGCADVIDRCGCAGVHSCTLLLHVSYVLEESLKPHSVIICTFECPIGHDPQEVTFYYAQYYKDLFFIFISDRGV